MKNNSKATMIELQPLNPRHRLVEAIDHLPNCCAKMSKYIKLAEIVIMQVFGYVENEWCFSLLDIMKRKLRKRLTMHLDVCSTVLYS
jgi:hypothetical protein